LFAKLEGQNPSGSVKDRIAKHMIEAGERSGELTPDRTILESTSGNTGISLAMIGGYKGYKVKLVMPDNVSVERREIMEAYGAEVVLCDGDRGTNGAIEVAHDIYEADRAAYWMPYQYGNPANVQAHYETTGAEIVADLPSVDVFVAGLGTGGTLMGTGKRIKEHNPKARIIAVEPHQGDLVQGLRSLDDGFIPEILDLAQLDGKILVRSQDAFGCTRQLMEAERIFCGISAGSVLHGAMRVARRMDEGDVVILLADGGWKYLSTHLWTQEVASVAGLDTKIWW
jgi:cysteine synthase B